jgi:hypothetical protein
MVLKSDITLGTKPTGDLWNYSLQIINDIIKVYIKEKKTKLSYCSCLLLENGYIIFVDIKMEEIT